MASSMPLWIGLMNSFGIEPPTVSFSNVEARRPAPAG